MKYYLLKIFIFFGIVLAQNSFITQLPTPFSSINLVFVSVIFITIVYNFRRGILWAILLGFFWDYYTFHSYGLLTVSLIITIFVCNLLFEVLFTNKSLYSLIVLGIISNIFFQLIYYGSQSLTRYIGVNDYGIVFSKYFLENLVWQVLFSIFLLFLIWNITYKMTTRLKISFISKEI